MKKFLKLIFGPNNNYSASDVALTKASIKSIMDGPPKPPAFDEKENDNLNKIFELLAKDDTRLADAQSMLKSGLILNRDGELAALKYIVMPYLINLKPIYEPRLSEVKENLSLIYESMQRGSKKGIYYTHYTYSPTIKTIDKLAILLDLLLSPRNIDKLDIEEKIKYINKYKFCLEPLDKIPGAFEPFYSQAKNNIAQLELRINQNISSINLDLKAKSLAELGGVQLPDFKISSFSANPLTQKCELLREKIVSLVQTYDLSPEDTVTLDNLLKLDIPKLLTSAGTTPEEIVKKYEEISGQKFVVSLTDLATKYEALVASVEEKYTSLEAHSIHHNVQSSNLYLDKKREGLGISDKAAETFTPKTLKASK